MVILVHGGAGNSKTDEHFLSAVAAKASLTLKKQNARAAVIHAVSLLENSGKFNAGLGSVRQSDGQIRMDASVMDSTLYYGAVINIQKVKNPIKVAELLCGKESCILCGNEATKFSRKHHFVTGLFTPQQSAHGTVGAVAFDSNIMAAATSTGGIAARQAGRVGDSALIGAGTYANQYGAVSCTGIGEDIVRIVLAKYVCDVMKHYHAQKAADLGIKKLTAIGGRGGLICVDAKGNHGVAYNTLFMSVAKSK